MAKANAAEQRFAAAGDLVVQLFAHEKRQRILAAAEHWPELPASSIAIITSASPSYVPEVLKGRMASEAESGCLELRYLQVPENTLDGRENP